MNNKFNSIQYMRAIAVVIITLVHLEPYINTALMRTKYSMHFLHYFGYSAVDLFFIVSGFVIWLTTHKHIPSAHIFFIKRIARIYPPYMFIITIAFFTIPYGFVPEPTGVVKMYLLYPYPLMEHILPVSWTLTYELFFYLTFTLLLLFKLTTKNRFLVIMGYALVIILINGYSVIVQTTPAMLLATTIPIFNSVDPLLLYYLTSPFIVEFCTGIGLAYLWLGRNEHSSGKYAAFERFLLRLRYPFYGLIMVVAIGLFVAKIDLALILHLRVLLFAPLWALLIYISLLHENCAPKSYRLPVFIELGNASYLIYLIHSLFLILINESGIVRLAYNYKYMGVLMLYLLTALMFYLCIILSKKFEIPFYHWCVNKAVPKKKRT